jgi:hypothetical protein
MSQVLIDPSQLKTSLESLGYNLKDYGSYWRTKAIYRGGDNLTALKIYKNTGVWTDYAANGSKSYPIQKLIELTLNTTNTHIINKYVNFEHKTIIEAAPKEKIEMEKIYPESLLGNLLPHLDFYSKKNLSQDTLDFYKCGYATSGQLFRRIVFPIYNYAGQIHGFSGRAVFWNKDSEFPKWKHIGKRADWVYPLYLKRNGVQEIKEDIEKRKSVIIVESVGDSMALFEHGYKNTFVTFGLGISSKVCSTLVSLDPDKIIISSNNDDDKETNHGLISACKSFLQLCSVFDPSKLEIRLPIKNDFFDMHSAYIDGENSIFSDWEQKKVNKEMQIEKIYEIAVANRFPQTLIKRAEQLKDEI